MPAARPTPTAAVGKGPAAPVLLVDGLVGLAEVGVDPAGVADGAVDAGPAELVAALPADADAVANIKLPAL